MDKVKYIKVSLEDRLPEKEGFYFNLSGTGKQIGYFDGKGFNESFINSTHYLKEIPDREEEMREMLDECRTQLEFLNDLQERGTTNSVLSRLNTLLES